MSVREFLVGGAPRLFVAAALVSTVGCAVFSGPDFRENFGESAAAARDAQVLDPAAGRRMDPVAELDGETAVNVVNSYRESFLPGEDSEPATIISID